MGAPSFTPFGVAAAIGVPADDNVAIVFGTGSDATLQYDGTNLLLNPKAVGSGVFLLTTDGKIAFRASTNFLHSNAAGELTLEAPTLVTVGVAGDIILGDGTLRTIYPQTASKMDLGKAANPFNSLVLKQGTIGNAVLTVGSVATNDDPIQITYQNRVATTDATVTTIHTFTVPTSTTYMIEAKVIARRTGGSAGSAEDGAGYVIRGTYKNTAGTVAIIGSVNADYTAESQAGWNATFTTSGATVLCQVTGALNNNVTWHMTANIWQVAS